MQLFAVIDDPTQELKLHCKVLKPQDYRVVYVDQFFQLHLNPKSQPETINLVRNKLYQLPKHEIK